MIRASCVRATGNAVSHQCDDHPSDDQTAASQDTSDAAGSSARARGANLTGIAAGD
jgi:hypothetical protein